MTQLSVDTGRVGPSRNGLDVATGAMWSQHPANEDHHADPVADAVANSLHWDLALPRHRVFARCNDGWVTLSGEVDRAYQRSSAEADVLRVRGVRGVTNAITIGAPTPEIGPAESEGADD